MSTLTHVLLLTALGASALASCGVASPDPAAQEIPIFQGDFHAVDETSLDPDFARFAARLRESVATRDTSGFLALVGADARFSFDGPPGGPADAERRWFSPDADASIWETVGRVCAGGFVSEDDAFSAPFVYALWPSDADPFAHVAIPETDVEAFDQPGGEVTARLSTIILPVLAPRNGDWWQVRLPTGAAAYVEAEHVVSPLGWRLSAWPDPDGTWKLQSLLSGG